MSRIGTGLLAVTSLLAMAGCATGPSNGAPAVSGALPATITVAVGPCFGFCPVYDVRVGSDDAVTFNGARHTAVLGARERKSGAGTYRSLVADLAPFRPATGSTAAVACEMAVTDMSAFTITWRDAAGGETVATLSGGCRGGPGGSLLTILRALPERLGIAEWSRQTTRPGVSRG